MLQAAPSATLAVDRVLQRCISLYATIRLTPRALSKRAGRALAFHQWLIIATHCDSRPPALM